MYSLRYNDFKSQHSRASCRREEKNENKIDNWHTGRPADCEEFESTRNFITLLIQLLTVEFFTPSPMIFYWNFQHNSDHWIYSPGTQTSTSQTGIENHRLAHETKCNFSINNNIPTPHEQSCEFTTEKSRLINNISQWLS